MSFPSTQKRLTGKNVWVVDSAATVHTSLYDDGMTEEEEEATDDDAITVGNGAKRGCGQDWKDQWHDL